MASITTPKLVEEVKLILADIGVNSNKFWNGQRYEPTSPRREASTKRGVK